MAPDIRSSLKKELASRWQDVSWAFGSSTREMLAFGESFNGRENRLVHVGVPTPPSVDGPGVEAALDWSAVRSLFETRTDAGDGDK